MRERGRETGRETEITFDKLVRQVRQSERVHTISKCIAKFENMMIGKKNVSIMQISADLEQRR